METLATTPIKTQAEIAAEAEAEAQLARERKIEEIRQRDPNVNWVNIGITTGKFSESLRTSTHKTYDECVAHSYMEDNDCFPIAALPESYWNARP